MRQILVKNNFGHKKGTRWRGHDVMRVEAFTDAVFAFAVTLLAVSLEVPKSFNELMDAMKGFIGFAATFAFLFTLWYRHYDFYRKYAIDDMKMIVLNGVFLLSVLFFIFPLKFMSYLIITLLFDYSEANMHAIMNINDMPQLLTIYMGGIASLMVVFALMYRHALQYRLHLQLNEEEEFEALRRYFLYVFSIPLMVPCMVLYNIVPIENSGYVALLILPLPIMIRMVKKKKIGVHWLLPKAVPYINEEAEPIAP